MILMSGACTMIINDFAARRRGPLMSHRGHGSQKAVVTGGFVYILGSRTSCGYRTYVGWTLDLERRLAEHNSGTGAEIDTRQRVVPDLCRTPAKPHRGHAPRMASQTGGGGGGGGSPPAPPAGSIGAGL